MRRNRGSNEQTMVGAANWLFRSAQMAAPGHSDRTAIAGVHLVCAEDAVLCGNVAQGENSGR